MCGLLNHNSYQLKNLCQVYQLTACFTCRILTKHSDEKLSVEAVKKHFFAENLYTDQYQDKALFRWRQRYSYVDSTYLERVKEIEANNSVDKDKTMSVQTTVKKMRLTTDLAVFKNSEHKEASFYGGNASFCKQKFMPFLHPYYRSKLKQHHSSLHVCRDHLGTSWRTHQPVYWVLQTATWRMINRLSAQLLSSGKKTCELGGEVSGIIVGMRHCEGPILSLPYMEQ